MLTADEHWEKYKEPLKESLRGMEDELKFHQYNTNKGIRSTFATIYSPVFIKVYNGTQCHRMLNEYFQQKGCIGVVNRMLSLEGNNPHRECENLFEVQQVFYSWLANESPWKECFIDPEIKKEDDIYLMNTSMPSNVLLSAILASRQMWEHTWLTMAWYDLMTAGINRHLAYILAANVKMDKHACYIKRDQVVTDWHTPFSHMFSFTRQLKQFMRNDLGDNLNPLYIEEPEYDYPNMVHEVFHKSSPENKNKSLYKILQVWFPLEAMEVPKSTFGKSGLDILAVKKDKFIKTILEAQDKIIEEIVE
jgi:hypothetical protein